MNSRFFFRPLVEEILFFSWLAWVLSWVGFEFCQIVFYIYWSDFVLYVNMMNEIYLFIFSLMDQLCISGPFGYDVLSSTSMSGFDLPVHLPLKQHGFELCGSTFMGIFFPVNMCHSSAWPVVGWICQYGIHGHRAHGRSVTVKFCSDFWLLGGLVPSTLCCSMVSYVFGKDFVSLWEIMVYNFVFLLCCICQFL